MPAPRPLAWRGEAEGVNVVISGNSERGLLPLRLVRSSRSLGGLLPLRMVGASRLLPRALVLSGRSIDLPRIRNFVR
jgi:hypothetical protein